MRENVNGMTFYFIYNNDNVNEISRVRTDTGLIYAIPSSEISGFSDPRILQIST
jgi:hypothetical protein